MRHLLDLDDLGAEGILEVMQITDSFAEVADRAIPKVPALRGRTVANLFFESSTRTRMSFEAAARRMSADVMNFSASGSSLDKGESLRDTVETVMAMGADALVVRHSSSGAPHQVARWADSLSGGSVGVCNAGDGWHQHPTQALLDTYTIREARAETGVTGDDFMAGLHVAIVGDSKHSRVARSNVSAFTALGAEVTLVGPRTLLPPAVDTWPVTVADELDPVLAKADVVYLLRMQTERMEQNLVPSLREYHEFFGLTERRVAGLESSTLVMHPGPMNRGVEIVGAAAQVDGAVITRQVANGVSVRMAVLYLMLGAGADLG